MNVSDVLSTPPLYPVLPASQQASTVEGEPAQTFRLHKIGELEAFLRAQIDGRSRLHQKYRRAVNILGSTCAVLGTVFVATGAVGASQLASGVGFVPWLVLEAVTGLAGLLDVAVVAVSCRCSSKASKHEAILIFAGSKLYTVHSPISKALEDCSISNDEYIN